MPACEDYPSDPIQIALGLLSGQLAPEPRRGDAAAPTIQARASKAAAVAHSDRRTDCRAILTRL